MKRDGHDRTVLGTAKGAGCEKGGRLVTLEGLQREGQPGTGILDKTPGPCAPRYAPRCGTRCARPSLYARVAPEQNIGRAAGSCTRGLPSARPAREESVLLHRCIVTVTGPLGPGPHKGASAPAAAARSKELLTHTGARPPVPLAIRRLMTTAHSAPLSPPHKRVWRLEGRGMPQVGRGGGHFGTLWAGLGGRWWHALEARNARALTSHGPGRPRHCTHARSGAGVVA